MCHKLKMYASFTKNELVNYDKKSKISVKKQYAVYIRSDRQQRDETERALIQKVN